MKTRMNKNSLETYLRHDYQTVSAKIVRLLQEVKKPLTAETISEMLNTKLSTVTARLNELRYDYHIIHEAYSIDNIGRYAIRPGGMLPDMRPFSNFETLFHAVEHLHESVVFGTITPDEFIKKIGSELSSHAKSIYK